MTSNVDQEVVERNEVRSEDSLLLLRLDLRWKSTEIIDQFVWDLANEYSDPDEFAAGMCKDLNIGSGKKNQNHLMSAKGTKALETEIQGLYRRIDGLKFQMAELAPVIAHAIRSEILEYHKEYNEELERSRLRGDPSAKIFAMTKKGTCKYANDKLFSRTGIVRKKKDLDTWSPVVTFLTGKSLDLDWAVITIFGEISAL